MTIKTNDSFPADYTFQYFDVNKKDPAELSTSEFKKGTWVLVGVPAAFSPPCSEQHLPLYIDQLNLFAQKGARVVVVNVDNLFANKAWAKSFGVDDKQDKILFVSDVGGKFLKAAGLTTTEVPPLGEVSSRFALVVKDGTVNYVGQEKTVAEVSASAADTVLKSL